MRVVLDVTAALRGGHDRGIGRYLAAVREANAALGNEVEEISYRMGSGRLTELLGYPAREVALRRSRADVFHAPTAYYAPVTRRVPTVVSMLDVIPLEVREHQRTGAKARLVHRIAARADAVMTLSEHSASRIVELLGVDRERIVVAPLPPAPMFAPGPVERAWSDRPYVAAMADLRTPDPHKRTAWLAEVAGHLRAAAIDTVLVGAGTDADAAPGIDGRGRLSDEAWADVLRGALVLVGTSAYEGQGMPPLEAIACGTPVVAMANTSLPEVVGAAGSLLDERTADGPRRLADEIVRLHDDPAALAACRAACAPQAARFTVDRFANGVSTAYRLAVERAG